MKFIPPLFFFFFGFLFFFFFFFFFLFSGEISLVFQAALEHAVRQADIKLANLLRQPLPELGYIYIYPVLPSPGFQEPS